MYVRGVLQMNNLTKEDRDATLHQFILGDLIDVCGRLMTPDLVDITCKKIFDDVLDVIGRGLHDE